MTLALDDPMRAQDAAARRRRREDLLLLALLLASDEDAAARLWDLFAPPAYRGLLRATPIEDVSRETGNLPPLWFDIATQRFGISRRGFISPATLRNAVDAFVSAAQRAMADGLRRVYAGTMDLAAWQTSVEQMMRQIALAIAMAAAGGAGRVTPEQLKRAGDGLLFPLERLTRFVGQIGARVVTQAAAIRRAMMYPSAIATGAGGFDDIGGMAHKAVGFNQEINVLDPFADHCRPTEFTEGCVEVTAAGWQPIGSLPRPGERTCRFNCKCHLEYRRV